MQRDTVDGNPANRYCQDEKRGGPNGLQNYMGHGIHLGGIVMFDQAYFDGLSRIVREINKEWHDFWGEKLIGVTRVDIITRDGEVFSVRESLKSYRPGVLHVVTHDKKTDGFRIVAIPFDRIERVEIINAKSKKFGFRMNENSKGQKGNAESRQPGA